LPAKKEMLFHQTMREAWKKLAGQNTAEERMILAGLLSRKAGPPPEH